MLGVGDAFSGSLSATLIGGDRWLIAGINRFDTSNDNEEKRTWTIVVDAEAVTAEAPVLGDVANTASYDPSVTAVDGVIVVAEEGPVAGREDDLVLHTICDPTVQR